MKKFWKFSNAVEAEGSKLILEGVISSESWWGDEVTPEAFRSELKEQKGDLTVVINSGGGDVFAGVSIYNALREFDGNVTIRVDGLAASIASVIAMAGNEVIMSPGSVMMIHKPWTMAVGDAKELDKVKEILNTIEKSIVPIYATRTGKTDQEIIDLLDAETWMTAEEAVELGFADKAEEATKKVSFSDSIKSAMSLNSELSFAMQASKNSLEEFMSQVAKAETTKTEDKDVREPIETEETETPATADVEETEVEGGAPQTSTVEAKAETEPKAEEVVDTKAKVKKTKSTKSKVKGKTTMPKEATIAQDQVIEPKEQATVTPKSEKVSMKRYLKSKDAMEAFARILEDNAGGKSEDVKEAWKNHLEIKLGVTNPDIFLPTALITEIQDAFEQGGRIWNKVFKTGVDVFNAAWDIQDDVNDEDGRARGYNRADEPEKQEQVLEFLNRVIRPQFIYKYITLNKEDVKNQRSTGALVKYVLSELPRRIVREIERAIVIGDGRVDGSDFKITSFTAVKADATADNFFASTYVRTADEGNYEAVVKASDEILSEGVRTLICKKGFVTDMKLERNENGGFVFPQGSDFASILGVDEIIEPDWMDEDEDNDAYLVVLNGYRTVGDDTVEAFTNFILKTNKLEYLQEVWAGGALTFKKCAVAIPTDSSS